MKKEHSSLVDEIQNEGLSVVSSATDLNIGTIHFNKSATAPKKKIFSIYFILARFLPALIGLLPLSVIVALFIPTSQSSIPTLLLAFLVPIGSIVVAIGVAFILPSLSKTFENRYYDHKRLFPTTQFLLYETPYRSIQFKDEFREKIKQHYTIQLPTQEEESLNRNEAILLICEAVDRIRSTVGDGYLVLNQNIVYGLRRNLIPAAIFGLLMSALGIAYSIAANNFPMVSIITILIAFYLFYILFHRKILDDAANTYSSQLLTEYMNLTIQKNEQS